MSLVSTVVSTALAPFTHYIYIALIALTVAGGFAAVIHERHVGAAAIAAADTAHAAIVAKKDQIIADNTNLQLIDVGNHAKILLAAPPIANAGLVCVAPRVNPTPAAAKSDDQSGQVSQLPARSFDPSGAILTLLSDDDIRINALVDTVEILNGYIEALTLTAAKK